MNKIKLFIVDDHYMIIEGISSLLKNEGSIDIIGHAKDAESCMAFLQIQQPDVIFLDINLPDKNGIDICADIRKMYPLIKIIALSTYNQNSYVEKMVANGANGYLLKNAYKEEMVFAIDSVMSNKTYLTKDIVQRIMENKTVKPILTKREKQILSLVAEGLTSNEIGIQLFISTTTVDTHRKHLLEKFKVNNTTSLIKCAQEMEIL